MNGNNIEHRASSAKDIASPAAFLFSSVSCPKARRLTRGCTHAPLTSPWCVAYSPKVGVARRIGGRSREVIFCTACGKSKRVFGGRWLSWWGPSNALLPFPQLRTSLYKYLWLGASNFIMYSFTQVICRRSFHPFSNRAIGLIIALP